MADDRVLVRLSDQLYVSLLQAPIGVLVICGPGCGRCDVYQADIERHMRRGAFNGTVMAKLVVGDERGSSFVTANPWILSHTEWPLSLVYRFGVEVDRLVANRASVLLSRIGSTAECAGPER